MKRILALVTMLFLITSLVKSQTTKYQIGTPTRDVEVMRDIYINGSLYLGIKSDTNFTPVRKGTTITRAVDNMPYYWNGSRWYNMLNSGVGLPLGITNNTSRLVHGDATWSGVGLIYDVTACDYYILGRHFNSLPTQKTLAVSDPSQPRIDVIYLDTSGNVGVLTGVPGSSPIKPIVNPISQLELTSVSVAAGATTPTIVTQTLVYNENVEWTSSGSGTTNFNYVSNPQNGSFSARIQSTLNPVTAEYLRFTAPSAVSMGNYKYLRFYIRLKTALSTNASTIQISLLNGSSSIMTGGGSIVLQNGSYGFDRLLTNTWQLITIPLGDYTYNNYSFDVVKFIPPNEVGDWHIDNVVLQSGSTPIGFSYVTSYNGLTGDVTQSLNGQTGSSQTFSRTNDANVTLTITSATNNHGFALGWTGTLADARITSASTWNAKVGGSGTNGYVAKWNASNTLTTGSLRDDGNSASVGMAPAGVNGSLSLLANLYLPNSTSTLGSIYKNGARWLHNSGGTSNNNIYLGQQAGNDSTGAQNFLNIGVGFGTLNKVSGFGNIGIGYSAGAALREWDGSQSGSRNVFIGYEAGLNAIGSSHSVIIGAGAGANLQGGFSQVLIGKSVGSAITTGTANTFVGSAINVTTGEWNVALGPDAMQSGTSASYNMVGGAFAATSLTTGYGNVMFGNHAGSGVTTGDNNVLLGQYAGNIVGSGNVMIGGFAAAYEAGLNGKLVIDAGVAGPSRHTLNGDFATQQIGVGRTLAELAAASGYKFQVQGNIYTIGNIKLGGIPAGNGNKMVMLDLSDSTFRLKDTVAIPSIDSVNSKWSTLGNTPSGTIKFGTLNNNGYNFVTNDVARASISAAGLFSTVQDAQFNAILIGQGPTSGLSHLRIGDATTLRDVVAGSLLNIGVGIAALKLTTTGDYNLAVGYTALEKNTTGSDQNAFGRQAGQNNVGDKNVFLGGASGVNCLTCANSIFVENSNGSGNGVATGYKNIVIGNQIVGLSPSLHNSIVIADDITPIIFKDSSGKMYLNAPTIVGSQGVANSTLESAGSLGANIITVTGNHTATSSNYTILVNNSGTATITLPAAATSTNRVYIIKKISGAANDVIIDGNGAELVEGAATQTLTTLNEVWVIQTNGTAWYKTN